MWEVNYKCLDITNLDYYKYLQWRFPRKVFDVIGAECECSIRISNFLYWIKRRRKYEDRDQHATSSWMRIPGNGKKSSFIYSALGFNQRNAVFACININVENANSKKRTRYFRNISQTAFSGRFRFYSNQTVSRMSIDYATINKTHNILPMKIKS